MILDGILPLPDWLDDAMLAHLERDAPKLVRKHRGRLKPTDPDYRAG